MAAVQQRKPVATRARRKPASAVPASKRNARRSTPKAVPHPTPAERAERGRAARAAAPRSEQGECQPALDRRDPVALLEEQAASRVTELVPIRYGRMLVSPFTFYRGAAYPMAADLAGAPRTGLEVQLCGDAHLSNFGAFAASDRRLVFSINDFDETLPGPFEWDVKRLVASFAVAGRDRGFDTRQRRSINRAAAYAYREGMRTFGEMSNLDLWYSRIDLDEIAALQAQDAGRKQQKQFERNRAKAQSKDSMKAFGRLTTLVNGERRIASDPPLIVPIEDVAADGMEPGELEEFIHGVFRSYRATLTPDRRQLVERYRYVHAARKVVGVGSVGTRAWIVLMLGRDDSDPLFLQLKEAEASVLEPFLGKSRFAKHGQRVVEGQRLTQAASDIMLGWIRIAPDGTSRDFYVRQLWDGKGSAIVETMSPKTMSLYARICGHALAKAHARSGDAIAIGSYLGAGDSFDRAMGRFAEEYADQNERDYDALRDAAASGRVAAETGL
jgi:uncharacterized protein (DUF2252 family)